MNIHSDATNHSCNSVESFLALLSRRGPLLGEFNHRQWIFRGHSNDEAYRLEPTALREGSSILRSYIPYLTETRSNAEQVMTEATALQLFLNSADEAALALPEDSQQLRIDLREFAKGRAREPWPPASLLSLLGLAQHHGLPTRLLDWTKNPLKAAFFAASGTAYSGNEEANNGNLSVWAFRTSSYHALDEWAPFKIVTAPSSSNPNLRAQEGVFTATVTSPLYEKSVDRRTLDEVVAGASTLPTPGIEISPDLYRGWFHRITLPRSLARALLWELDRENITSEKLYPDFYGVVKALREKRNLHFWFP